jgi:TolB-like protein
MFHLKLLGGAVIEDDGGAACGLTSRRHSVALLALLATASSATLSRGKLVGLLWPDSPERTARNRLTSCLYQVRSELGEEAVLTVGGDLRFNPDVLDCDVTRFDTALAADDFRGAVELYCGPFLDGFWLRGSNEFERWMDRERDRLRRGYHEALEALASEAAERGEFEAAAGLWRKREGDDPFDSRVAVRLAEVLAEVGNRAEALRVVEDHARRLEEEFGMRPGRELRDLIDRLQAPPPTTPPNRSAKELAPANGDASPVRSIAVLPFENLSGTADAEPFALGLHDDLLTELSRISALTVISRTSVQRFRGSDRAIPEIARELGVGTVVEGGVQSAGGRLRLNVQLIDARSDTHRWVERYDRKLSADSIFDIQSELAQRIARALELELTPMEKKRAAREPTHDLEAYRLYAQGRRQLDKRTDSGIRRAAEHFGEAVERDARYALAWVGLADALSLLHDYGCEAAERVLPRAEEAVIRALELAPDLAEAHTSLGLLRGNQRKGYAAVAALEHATELHPGYAEAHNWLSWICQVLGQAKKALAHAEQAVALDPLSPEAVSNLALSSLATGDAERALREARRTRELQSDWTTGAFYEGLALYHLGRFSEAIPVLLDVRAEWAGSGPQLTLALAYVASGDDVSAGEMLAGFEEDGDHYAVGVVRLALRDREKAFEAFRRVQRWDYWPVLSIHHFYPDVLDPLRADELGSRLLRAAARAWGADGAEPAAIGRS